MSRRRKIAALCIAGFADALQFALGPFGLLFFDEIIDVTAMLACVYLIGFHPLLLPTFLIELVPVVDVLPTWTACVALVLTIRKKHSPKEIEGAVKRTQA